MDDATADVERRRRLLGPSVSADDPALLTFALGPHRFGLPLDRVVEVTRAVAVAELPGAPPIVDGAVNYRGRIVPVLDVATRFGLDSPPLAPDQHFVFAQGRFHLVALRVERAEAVVGVEPSAVQPPDIVLGSPHVLGVARLSDGLIVIQDLDRFLSVDEEQEIVRALEETIDTVAPAPVDLDGAAPKDQP